MVRRFALALSSVWLWWGFALAQPLTLGLAAGPAGSEFEEIGRDLATLVAPHAHVAIRVANTAGTIDNARRLQVDRGVGLALVHADAYSAFSDAASPRQAVDLLRPLRVVLPLWAQEIHFVARRDAPFDAIAGMRDARINVGPPGSGSAYTIANVYRRTFDRPLPPAQASFLGTEEALRRLVTDRSVDVVAVIGSQPLRVLAQMEPEAKRYIKLLSADPVAAMPPYRRARLAVTSYPNVLDRDVTTLAVPLLLVTRADAGRSPEPLVRIASALCENFAELRHEGHPRWRTVGPRRTLPPDWLPYGPTEEMLGRCESAGAAIHAGAG